MSQELKELKAAHRRFQSVESGAKNVVFIQCEAPVCPEDLVHYMLTSIKATSRPCAKYSINIHWYYIMLLCVDIVCVYCLLLIYAEPLKMISKNVPVKC